MWETSPHIDIHFPTPKLTFSSAETSAILGSGAGARFLISNKTSGKKVRRAGYYLTSIKVA